MAYKPNYHVIILGRNETQASLANGRYKDIKWRGQIKSGTISEEILGKYELKCTIELSERLDFENLFYITCPYFTKFATYGHHGNVSEVFYITQVIETYQNGRYSYEIVAPSVFFLSQYQFFGRVNADMDVPVNCPTNRGTWAWSQLFLDNDKKPQNLRENGDYLFVPQFHLTWHDYEITSSETPPEALTQYESTDPGLADIYSQTPLSETLVGNSSIFNIFYKEYVDRSNFDINIQDKPSIEQVVESGVYFSLRLGVDIPKRTISLDRTSQYNTVIYNIAPYDEGSIHVVGVDNNLTHINDEMPFEMGLNAKTSPPFQEDRVYKANGYYWIANQSATLAWSMYTRDYLKSTVAEPEIDYEVVKTSHIDSDICILGKYGIIYDPMDSNTKDYAAIVSYTYDIVQKCYSNVGLNSLQKGIV